jgi:hypothetical protein
MNSLANGYILMFGICYSCTPFTTRCFVPNATSRKHFVQSVQRHRSLRCLEQFAVDAVVVIVWKDPTSPAAVRRSFRKVPEQIVVGAGSDS